METPKSLVRWNRFHKYLQQALGDGVQCVILMDGEGHVLASSSENHMEDSKPKAVAAVVSSLWSDMKTEASACFDGFDQKAVLIECERGCIAAQRIRSFVLVLFAPDSTETTLLVAKSRELAKTIAEPLSMV